MKKKLKWFISAILPNDRQVGLMQFEATEDEYKDKAEKLCPVRASFRAYRLEKFDANLPIGKFIDVKQAKKLGY